MTKPTVYIFRGAPASGKGTLVPAFCKLLEPPIAHIDQDKFRWDIHLVGRHVPDVTENEHQLAWQNTKLIYEQYLKAGKYTIVIEGLFTWNDESSSQGNARQLAELAAAHGFDCKSIVLKAGKTTLLQRNAARSYSVPADEFDVLYDGVYTVTGPDEIIIDSTGQTAEQTVQTLQKEVIASR